jgi:hypothetical protein
MVRCPQCSCPTIERQQRCLACGGAVGLVSARIDGRVTDTSSGLRVSIVEVVLFLVLAALVVSLSIAVLA